MRVRKQVEVPARVEEREVEVRCDLCGAESTRGESRWEALPNIASTVVWMETGVIDRDGGGRTRTVEFDICPRCFETTLVEALRALGATPTVREEEY